MASDKEIIEVIDDDARSKDSYYEANFNRWFNTMLLSRADKLPPTVFSIRISEKDISKHIK